jgi:hypothetical protein
MSARTDRLEQAFAAEEGHSVAVGMTVGNPHCEGGVISRVAARGAT